METTLQFDVTDPMVTAITYVLTWAAARVIGRGDNARWRPLLIVLAFAIAIFGRAACDTLQGDALAWPLVLRAFAAGAAAVAADQGLGKLILPAVAQVLGQKPDDASS